MIRDIDANNDEACRPSSLSTGWMEKKTKKRETREKIYGRTEIYRPGNSLWVDSRDLVVESGDRRKY